MVSGNSKQDLYFLTWQYMVLPIHCRYQPLSNLPKHLSLCIWFFSLIFSCYLTCLLHICCQSCSVCKFVTLTLTFAFLDMAMMAMPVKCCNWQPYSTWFVNISLIQSVSLSVFRNVWKQLFTFRIYSIFNVRLNLSDIFAIKICLTFFANFCSDKHLTKFQSVIVFKKVIFNSYYKNWLLNAHVPIHILY